MTTSWREATPQDVQDDVDGLFAFLAPFAEQTMSKRRQLAPFGAVVTASGEMRAVASMPPGRTPSSMEIRELLIEGMQGEREQLRAVALVEDVRLPSQGTDAIRFNIEHRTGLALTIFWPYSVNSGLRRKVVFGAYTLDEGEHIIWPEA